jgi:hypothetical protein
MRAKAGLASERAQVETLAAAGIENDVARRCGHDLRDRAQQRPGRAAIVQSPPRCQGGGCVARLFRPPIPRLEQVNISATRNVERMAARTEQPSLLAHKRRAAIADGAQEQ